MKSKKSPREKASGDKTQLSQGKPTQDLSKRLKVLTSPKSEERVPTLKLPQRLANHDASGDIQIIEHPARHLASPDATTMVVSYDNLRSGGRMFSQSSSIDVR